MVESTSFMEISTTCRYVSHLLEAQVIQIGILLLSFKPVALYFQMILNLTNLKSAIYSSNSRYY